MEGAEVTRLVNAPPCLHRWSRECKAQELEPWVGYLYDSATPLDDLDPDEFDEAYAETEPLADALWDALNTYSALHPDLTMLAAHMAADMLRHGLQGQLDAAEADA